MNLAPSAYMRVSTEEQALSGLGLADQRATLEAEAKRRGWDDVDYVSDDGYSAKNLARPGIKDALDRLRSGKAGVLVVSKLDRLSRSLLDFAKRVCIRRPVGRGLRGRKQKETNGMAIEVDTNLESAIEALTDKIADCARATRATSALLLAQQMKLDLTEWKDPMN